MSSIRYFRIPFFARIHGHCVASCHPDKVDLRLLQEQRQRRSATQLVNLDDLPGLGQLLRDWYGQLPDWNALTRVGWSDFLDSTKIGQMVLC